MLTVCQDDSFFVYRSPATDGLGLLSDALSIFCIDINYRPIETVILSEAKDLGIATMMAMQRSFAALRTTTIGAIPIRENAVAGIIIVRENSFSKIE